jgi:multiple antibiotic resistance protein
MRPVSLSSTPSQANASLFQLQLLARLQNWAADFSKTPILQLVSAHAPIGCKFFRRFVMIPGLYKYGSRLMDLSEFANYFVALLVVANPLSALPAVLGITRNMSVEEKKRTGITSAVAVGVILLIATWIGTPLLMVLGIRLPAFQVAGGFILFLMALSMLNAEESPIKQTPDESKERRSDSSAVVPLAIPIIAGPGAISTVIVKVGEFPGVTNLLLLSAAACLVAFVMGVLLYFAGSLERIFKRSGINIINRIGGLLLTSIAVQMLAGGIIDIFPALKNLASS